MDRINMEEDNRMQPEEKMHDIERDGDVIMNEGSPVKQPIRQEDLIAQIARMKSMPPFNFMNGGGHQALATQQLMAAQTLINNNNETAQMYEKIQSMLQPKRGEHENEDEQQPSENISRYLMSTQILKNITNGSPMAPQIPFMPNNFGMPPHPQMPSTPGSAGSRESSGNGTRSPTETPEPGPGSHQYSYEDQYKQVREPNKHSSFEEDKKKLYDLSPDPKRKDFLDDLFKFMHNKGTPINRLPIMAKQVLDLYELFNLVVDRGGLVDVINKKLWQEIIKGLRLPSSITSAAFTLRTQYMKYLYPYECETHAFSSPAELQQAIDGNRREGRRNYSNYGDMVQPSQFALQNFQNFPSLTNPLSLMGGGPRPSLNGNGVHPFSQHDILGRDNSPPADAFDKINLIRFYQNRMHLPPTLPESDHRRSSPPIPQGLNTTPQKEALDLNTKEEDYPEHWQGSSRSNIRGRESMERSKSDDEMSAPKRQALNDDSFRTSSSNSLPSPIPNSTSMQIVTKFSDSKDEQRTVVVSIDIDGQTYKGTLFPASSRSPPRSRTVS